MVTFPPRIRAWLGDAPWAWSFIAATLAWFAIAALQGRGLVGTLSAIVTLAPFLILAGIGQMFVITLGNGSIDLSLPYTITLAAFVSTQVMASGHGSLELGIVLGLGCGAVVGLANVFAIRVLAIPPIVATLATGLMTQSASTAYSESFSARPDPRLHAFTLLSVGGISLLAILCVGMAVVSWLILHRTIYGRSVQAIGQNLRAARFAGLSLARTEVVTYVLSGLLAATSGILLGGYLSPSLELGTPYLLDSIAVVVLGGSLIAGGRSFVSGVWGASVFLLFLETLLNVLHISIAAQDIVKGALVILVLSLVGSRRST